MSPSQDEPFSQTFSQTFSSDFQQRVSGITATLDDSQVHVEQLQKDVAGLSKFLSDVVSFLPSYDQKRYESQLKDLEERVEQKRKTSSTSNGERKRFAFRKKAQSSTPSSGVSTPQPSSSLPASAPASRTGPTIHNIKGQILTLSALPEHSRSGTLTLSNITDSIIDLTRTTTLQILSAYLTSLSGCVVILPPIAGSIMIHSLSRCTVVVSCHQLRIHDSKDVNILLELNAPDAVPILEGCARLHFGAYSSLDANSFPSYTPQDFSNVLASDSGAGKNWDFLSAESTPDVQRFGALVDGPMRDEARVELGRCLPSVQGLQ